ncbi:hypothetical protein HDU87_008829 [Geranomyces variabilis]|uniref:Uncharacterized protein n=1 Tax=Geranomyces variabilis TaxID=109894 RepID=A0AAD5TC78_9FUNG|nr:hypothetical protein HDU87_008829 [Geranomyces variabilis]
MTDIPPVAQLPSSFHLPRIGSNTPIVSRRPSQQQHQHHNHSSAANGPTIAFSSSSSLPVAGGRQPLLRRSHSRVGLGLGLNLENAFVKRDDAKVSTGLQDRKSVGSTAGPEAAASAAEETTSSQLQEGRSTRRRSGWEWLKGTKSSALSVAEVVEENPMPEEVQSAHGGDELSLAPQPGDAEQSASLSPATQPLLTQLTSEESKHQVTPRRPITFNLQQQPPSGSDGDHAEQAEQAEQVESRPQTPLSVRKRRSGWWDGTANREMEMRRVKNAVRRTGTGPADADKADKAPYPPTDDPAILPADEGIPRDAKLTSTPNAISVQPAPLDEAPNTDTQHAAESDRASRLRKRNSFAAMMSVLHMNTLVQDEEDPCSAESRLDIKHRSVEVAGGPSKDVQVDKQEEHVAPTTEDRPAVPSDFGERERALTTRLRQLQSQVQQLHVVNARQKHLITSLSSNHREAASPLPLPPELGVHLMARYCDANRMDGTVHAFVSDTGPAGKSARRTVLWDRLVQKRFTEAVKMVEDVMRAEMRPRNGASTDGNASRGAHFAAAFEDLLYVLTKYMCIHLVQIGESSTAHKVLDGVLRPKVDRERAGSSRGRGEWFLRDLTLLADLVRGAGADADNPYAQLAWGQELEGFWNAARTWRRFHAARAAEAGSSAADAEHGGPLFARALGEFFCDDNFDAGADAPNPLTLNALHAARCGLEKARALLADYEDTRNKEDASVSPKRYKSRRRPGSAAKREQEQSASNVEVGIVDAALASSIVAAPNSPSPPLHDPTSQWHLTAKQHTKPQKPPWSSNVQTPPHPPTMPSAAPTSNRKSVSSSADLPRRSSRTARSDDHHSGHTGYSFNSESEMPPQPNNMLSAEFALSTICGPVLNDIRALDVTCIPETGQIVAATAGSHDRSDKRISLWDVRSGTLLTQLDNGTSKPVTCLAFHPDDPGLLLSADMEFDVKIWDWREPGGGHVVRLWRKHHTRIVFRVAFVPGGDNQAATCSGDQSIKVFPLDGPNAGPGAPAAVSVHANEPFTSFVFVGNPDDKSQQKLIASLSYSIRIYRLRTATLLHTIQMNDLRTSKTPITALSSHPVHDSYILVSCDNQLQLVNLHTESTVKTYQSRNIPHGVRVEGQFSPCGGWVYCGTWDVKGRVKKKDNASSSVVATGTAAGGTSDFQQQQQVPRKRSTGAAGGVVIWKVHTGKSELLDCGDDVSACRWVLARQNRRGSAAGDAGFVERKCLVAAGLDRMIRMYL